jgi:hypothetical protein
MLFMHHKCTVHGVNDEQFINWVHEQFMNYSLLNICQIACIYMLGIGSLYMSHVMTKRVCDQHGSRPACTSAQSDQVPCCQLSWVSPLVMEYISEQHGSWSDCTDPCWSQTHYVGFVVTWVIYWWNTCVFGFVNPCHWKETMVKYKHSKVIWRVNKGMHQWTQCHTVAHILIT